MEQSNELVKRKMICSLLLQMDVGAGIMSSANSSNSLNYIVLTCQGLSVLCCCL